MSNPFDYSNNISQSTLDIWTEESESEYSPFMVNRALSQFYDTCMFAQEMNSSFGLTNRMQYDFLRLSINPKKKRLAKWYKPEKDAQVDAICSLYNISIDVARQYVKLISKEDLKLIMEKTNTGGRNAK